MVADPFELHWNKCMTPMSDFDNGEIGGEIEGGGREISVLSAQFL